MPKRLKGFEDELRALGREIARRREELGLTQAELATRCKLSTDGVVRIEVARSAPTAISLFGLARALGCSPADFFQKQPKRAPAVQRVAALLEDQEDEVVDTAAACVRAIVKLTAARRPPPLPELPEGQSRRQT